jgi:hypothetical protein
LHGPQNTLYSVVQDIACNINAIFGVGVFEDETCFEQVSCQYFMFLENVMLLEVEIIFLVVHLRINYFGFLCVNTSLTKIVVLPHI